MGLFDFLFGSKSRSSVEVLSDRIWMSQTGKFNGIRRELNERKRSDSVAILLIAHFPKTLERLNSIVAEYKGDIPMVATLAEDLTVESARRLTLDETARIDMIVVERHPLLSVDDQLMRFLFFRNLKG